MPSGNLPAQPALTTPAPSMILYTVISPFGVTDDRKISANDLLSTITANISDLSLQFDDGQATATVSAAGKAKIIYNALTDTMQVSLNGAAYVDLGGGGGGGAPGGPTHSVQVNAGGGSFGGFTSNLYNPATATGELTINQTDDNHTAVQLNSKSIFIGAPVLQLKATGGGGLIDFDPENSFAATATTDALSVKISSTGLDVGMGIWSANANQSAYLTLYAGTLQTGNLQVLAHAASFTPVGLIVASSGSIEASSAYTGGILLLTRAAAPIVFGTGGTATSNERGRFDANGLTLGHASVANGQLTFAVSGSAHTQSFKSGAAPVSTLTFVWPTADPTAGQQLTASAPVAGVVTLTWT